MRTVTNGPTTYQLRDGVSLSDLMEPSEVTGIEAPSPPSDYTTRFPSDKRPGDKITWTEGPNTYRTGTIIDRAPQGVERTWRCSTPCSDREHERGGYWFWVQPDKEGSDYVRVRYYNRGTRKGQAHRDNGAMVVRSITGSCGAVAENIHHLKKMLGVTS